MGSSVPVRQLPPLCHFVFRLIQAPAIVRPDNGVTALMAKAEDGLQESAAGSDKHLLLATDAASHQMLCPCAAAEESGLPRTGLLIA